jgi:membrane-associated phospholipid phosphatase
MTSTGTREGGGRREKGGGATALWILAGYLTVTLIPGGIAARGDGGLVAVFGLHVVVLAVVVFLGRREEGGGRSEGVSRWIHGLGAWLPLIAIPLLYAELPTLIAGAHSTFHDAAVQRWELSLFGGSSPAQTLAGSVSSLLPPPFSLVLSELLHLSYLSYYFIIYVPPVVLWVRKRERAFLHTTAALMAVFATCYLVFIGFPVQGPRYLWPAPAGVPDGPVRAFALSLLQAGSSRGTAFPSSHVAVAFTQTVLALYWQRSVGVACLVLSILLGIGAVWGGFHYGIDVLAGAALGLTVGASAINAQRSFSGL